MAVCKLHLFFQVPHLLGEEDLLTLPILAFFPEQTIVLYGQPNEGLVIVGAMGDAKDLARKTLSEMGVRSQPTAR